MTMVMVFEPVPMLVKQVLVENQDNVSFQTFTINESNALLQCFIFCNET